MNFLLAFIPLILSIIYVHTANEQEFTVPDKLWNDYRMKENKIYRSAAEATMRRNRFAQSHAFIEAHNQAGSTYKLGHNGFSDFTLAERRRRLGKRPSPSAETASSNAGIVVPPPSAPAPVEFDLRATKCVGPVKQQGNCGCCWAFSAITPLEFSYCYFKNNKKFVTLSEQQLVDCDTLDGGCDGGGTAYQGPWKYLKSKSKGVMTDAAYPYSSNSLINGQAGTCAYNANKLAIPKIASYGKVNPDPANIQNAMQTYGVLSACLNVREEDDSIMLYKSGVYQASDMCIEGLAVNGTTHCVSLVGWGTQGEGGDYWIMRNSWGPKWGESGYMLMKRGEDTCGIEREVGYVAL